MSWIIVGLSVLATVLIPALLAAGAGLKPQPVRAARRPEPVRRIFSMF